MNGNTKAKLSIYKCPNCNEELEMYVSHITNDKRGITYSDRTERCLFIKKHYADIKCYSCGYVWIEEK